MLSRASMGVSCVFPSRFLECASSVIAHDGSTGGGQHQLLNLMSLCEGLLRVATADSRYKIHWLDTLETAYAGRI